MLHVLLIGSGAVGIFYASKLPCQVSIVCRSNYEAVVKQQGFRIQSQSKETFFKPWAIYDSISHAYQQSLAKGVLFDYILIATKALPNALLDAELSCFFEKDHQPTVVLIQNGLRIEEPFVSRFPKAIILSAVTAISSAQTEPGLIVHYRWASLLVYLSLAANRMYLYLTLK